MYFFDSEMKHLLNNVTVLGTSWPIYPRGLHPSASLTISIKI